MTQNTAGPRPPAVQAQSAYAETLLRDFSLVSRPGFRGADSSSRSVPMAAVRAVSTVAHGPTVAHRSAASVEPATRVRSSS